MIERTKGAPLLLQAITPLIRTNSKRLPAGKRNIFILSTGRTGTTFLAAYFNNLPDVHALHEPRPSRILRMWSMAGLEKKTSDTYLASVLRQKRQQIYTKSKRPVYIESNPYIVGFANVLDKVFDDPIVIHVVRDPRDFVRSSMNHGNGAGMKLFFNYHVPFWYAKVEQILELGDKKLPMKYRAAAYWKIVNELLLEYGKHHPNYHLVRYEELFASQQNGLAKLAHIIGLKTSQLKGTPEAGDEAVNRSKHGSMPPWQEWNNEDCRIVNELCQPIMKQLGYGLEPEWEKRI